MEVPLLKCSIHQYLHGLSNLSLTVNTGHINWSHPGANWTSLQVLLEITWSFHFILAVRHWECQHDTPKIFWCPVSKTAPHWWKPWMEMCFLPTRRQKEKEDDEVATQFLLSCDKALGTSCYPGMLQGLQWFGKANPEYLHLKQNVSYTRGKVW